MEIGIRGTSERSKIMVHIDDLDLYLDEFLAKAFEDNGLTDDVVYYMRPQAGEAHMVKWHLLDETKKLNDQELHFLLNFSFLDSEYTCYKSDQKFLVKEQKSGIVHSPNYLFFNVKIR